MIDLVVLHPGAAHGIYGALGDTLTALEPPLWARLIAGYVRDRGYSVRIIDAEAEQQGPHEVGQIVRDLRPRLVCIAVYGHQPSASTQQMVGAGAIAKAIKAQCEAPIIMVGGHPSALPERTLREEAVDFIGFGEGPITVLGLLESSIQAGAVGDQRIEHSEAAKIPGLVYWGDIGVVINKAAPLIEDLSELHGDVWDILPMRRYRAHNWQCFPDLKQRQPYASIYTSLNCPYQCSFCCISAPFGGNRYQMRDPLHVVAEVVHLYEVYGVRTFKIIDELFVLNERHYSTICKGLIASGIADKLNIWAYARVDTVKPETLGLLRAAGIRWLALGIESASEHVRDGANKKMRTSDIVGVVKAVQAADINVIGNFMFGLPDDTVDTMQETLDLALECMPDFANFYSTMAYPGSALYAQALREGWTLPETWRGYSQHNDDCRPLDTQYVPGARVLQFRDDAFNTFFSDPGYLAHVERKFGAETLEHVRQMTTYKLKRKLLGDHYESDESPPAETVAEAPLPSHAR